jgi:hypothetical protein
VPSLNDQQHPLRHPPHRNFVPGSTQNLQQQQQRTNSTLLFSTPRSPSTQCPRFTTRQPPVPIPDSSRRSPTRSTHRPKQLTLDRIDDWFPFSAHNLALTGCTHHQPTDKAGHDTVHAGDLAVSTGANNNNGPIQDESLPQNRQVKMNL